MSGLKHAKKLWPKVVGGRWNSCSEALSRMKQVEGQSVLQPVLQAILASKASQATSEKRDAGQREGAENERSRSCVDEISYEETKHFQDKMGRWRRRTQECVEDALWWVIGEGMRIAQLTVVHFSETQLVILILLF